MQQLAWLYALKINIYLLADIAEKFILITVLLANIVNIITTNGNMQNKLVLNPFKSNSIKFMIVVAAIPGY